MPKPILEVTLKEWAATREKLLYIVHEKSARADLLDAIFERTEENSYLPEFMAKVKNELNFDLNRRTPVHPDSLDAVIREINVLRSIIEDIDAFIEDEERDPYCEDVYHDDDPRLNED